VPQAGYAAIATAVIYLFTRLIVWIDFNLYAGTNTLLHNVSSEHAPSVTAVTVDAVIMAAVSGVLAFFIFRRSRFAVIAMLVFVIIPQLYTWFVAHSLAGTLPSIIVAAFLLRGARRILQDHAEQKEEATKEV